jgi:signal transduction histidine kinase
MMKHADASEANLSIAEDCGAIQIIAEDNGKGFSNSTSSKGIGLKNIDNRIAYLKGTLHIDSNTSGTTIVITLPI